MSQLELQTFQLFQNDAIGRKLSPDGVRAVASRLISTGNGEWEDTSQTRLRIILKSPESLAVDVYNWAKRNDFIGTVFTVYELHSGEDHSDSGFYGTESVDLVRALRILERDGKVCESITHQTGFHNDCYILSLQAAIMRGSIPDEDGVKFLADR